MAVDVAGFHGLGGTEMRKNLRRVGQVVGLLIAGAGLSNLGDDLAEWKSILGKIDAQGWRWILVIFGFLIVVGSSWLDLRRLWRKEQSSTTGGGFMARGTGSVTDNPQVVGAPTISMPTQIGTPTIIQGSRPGWSAICEESTGTDRGARLSIGSDGEEAAEFRCLVEMGRGRWERAGLPKGDHATILFPSGFDPRPSIPLMPGEYRAMWYGQIRDASGAREMYLSERTFKVNEGGQIYCVRGPDRKPHHQADSALVDRLLDLVGQQGRTIEQLTKALGIRRERVVEGVATLQAEGRLAARGEIVTRVVPLGATRENDQALPINPVHVQRFEALSEWRIHHGWSRHPVVRILDHEGNEVIAGVRYPDDQSVVVSFAGPQSGEVRRYGGQREEVEVTLDE